MLIDLNLVNNKSNSLNNSSISTSSTTSTLGSNSGINQPANLFTNSLYNENTLSNSGVIKSYKNTISNSFSSNQPIFTLSSNQQQQQQQLQQNQFINNNGYLYKNQVLVTQKDFLNPNNLS